ncbi:MAG TPA: sigma-70 family RNA polymerase sigma factor [Phycisphaerae bacterium]|nr:sigma-70 family RNA polymerase sigma factor [Phycisphaerae bacterium]
MPESQPLTGGDVTTLLVRAQKGDRLATEELFPLVYEELRTLAARHLSRDSGAQTLQPTALVHEAFIRLVGPGDSSWENRRHFFGAAAKAIRRILIDHARARRRMKRGEGVRPSPLNEADVCVDGMNLDILALNEALERLGTLDSNMANLVELRFFGGLSMEEIGLATGVSPSTLARTWRFARSWLYRELTGDQPK